MKAVIPVAGIGTRLRPHTHTQPKALIPVAGKPILAHIIDRLMAAGIREFVFVIGYLGDQVENFVSKSYPELKTHFVIQTLGKGVGHAIWLAKEEIAEDEILIVFGDTIIDADLPEMINSNLNVVGIQKVADPRLFGVAEVDQEGFVNRLVEKPSIPKSNLALVGIYKIKDTAALMEALEYNISNKIKTQNEFHLTDALMRMVEQGSRIKTFTVDHWYDCGKKEILLETNAILLNRNKTHNSESWHYPNTIIIPPVHIAPNCKISNSIIGPNVSIGEGASINYSILKESIIGPYAVLENALLRDSLIGNDATLHGLMQSLNIGDSTEIKFS